MAVNTTVIIQNVTLSCTIWNRTRFSLFEI